MTCCIYGYTHMRHDKIIGIRTCSAHQCRVGIGQGIRFPGKGRCNTRRPLWHLKKPSLSLLTQSWSYECAGSDSGTKSPFHDQALTGSNSNASAIRKLHGNNFKRSCHAGTGSLFPWDSRAWIREGTSAERSIWSIILTDYQKRKSFKFIKF